VDEINKLNTLHTIIRDVNTQLHAEFKSLTISGNHHLHYNSIDVYDDNTIHCPIPKYGCNHRNEAYKYGCDKERRDCAMNMMYNEDLD
jgi:hypothetical protein